MSQQVKSTFLKKISETSPTVLKRPAISELVKAYEDLEKTLRVLKKNCEKNLVDADSTLRQINVRKLIDQLSRSKKKLERKIGNTILLEKQSLKKRIRAFTTLTRSNRV
jgi:ribosomal protein S21